MSVKYLVPLLLCQFFIVGCIGIIDPDGTDEEFQPNSLPDGTSNSQVIDETGTLQTFTITNPLVTTNSMTVIEWTSSSTNAVYDLLVSRNDSCTDSALEQRDIAGTSIQLDGSLVGDYYICLSARLTSGTSIAASNSTLPLKIEKGWINMPGPPTTQNPVWRGVWTGESLIFRGAEGPAFDSFNNTVFLPTETWSYNVRLQRWDRRASGPQSQNLGPRVVWTGERMLSYSPGLLSIVNGNASTILPISFNNYNFVDDQWSNLNSANIPRAGAATTLWDGTGLILYSDRGYRYDPVLNQWSAFPGFANGVAGTVWYSYAVKRGEQMIFWGGRNQNSFLDSGHIYDLNNQTWAPLVEANKIPPRFAHASFLVGSKFFVAGGLDDSFSGLSSVYAYDFTNQTWAQNPSSGGPPAGLYLSGAVWTGHYLAVLVTDQLWMYYP